MELHNTSLGYAFAYQNIEFHITTIIKEFIAGKCVTHSMLYRCHEQNYACVSCICIKHDGKVSCTVLVH